MELWEIREIARAMGVGARGLGKAELVRAIQRAEGAVDCFGTAMEDECDEENCMWREDCFAETVAAEKTA